MAMEPTGVQEPAAGTTPRKQPRRMRGMTAAVLAVALLGVATVAGRGSHHSAPYGPTAVAASIQLTVVPVAQAQQRIDQLVGAGRLNAVVTPGPDIVVGQLLFHTPSNAPKAGQYSLFVIDNDSHQVVPGMWGIGPVGSHVGQGWDGHYPNLAKAYSWLQPLAVQDGSAVSFPPDARGPVTFEATLEPGSLPITDPSTQLTIALAFFAADGHIYWAEKLPA